MIPLRRPAGLLIVLVVLGLVAACGPTAEALHPTLAPHASHAPGTPILPPAGSITPVTPQTTAPGTPQGSTIPAQSATPVPLGVGEPLTGFPTTNAFEVTGVVPIGDGFLAVGFGPMPGQDYFGSRQGIVWTSSDGITWQESAEPAFANMTPTGVVTLGSDIYVFGEVPICDPDTDPECDDAINTVIYRSSGGGGWEQLQQTPDIQQATFDGESAADSLLVARGSAGDLDETTTLWTSGDGLAWTPATNLAGMDPLDSAIAGGPGVIAFGRTIDDQTDDVAMVGATSADGVTFSAATVPSVPTGEIDDITMGATSYVGVGYAQTDVDPTIALALTSTDGLAWTQAQPSDDSFANGLMYQVHPAAAGYVAVGSTIDEVDPDLETLRAWTSADGQSWRSAGDVGGSFTQFGASALGARGLVIFTADQPDIENESDATSTINAWFVPADRLAP